MTSKWSSAFQIAAVYVGTIVGAGFATGREIVEFFTRFGFFGLIGMMMSGYLFVSMGTKLMTVAAKIGATSYKEFNYYLYGKMFGSVINVVTLVMLLGVNSVMLAGAGAVFEEQLGLPKTVGILFSIGLAIVVMLVGTKGIIIVNSFVVPTMIIFSFVLMYLSMKLPNFYEQLLYIPHADDGWKSVIAPFSYTALNLALAQAVLVPIATEVKDEKIIKLGGIIGGIALTFILFASHFTLITLPNVTAYDIPMAVIMKNLASSFYGLFILVIYGEIFTSIIGNVFGLERQLKQVIKIPSLVIVLSIFFVTYLISQVNYSTLLSYLYPLFGYISVTFIVLLWIKDDKVINKT